MMASCTVARREALWNININKLYSNEKVELTHHKYNINPEC